MNPRDTSIEKELTMPEKTIDVPVTVRFRDLDAMGHVNNATYFTYLEQARIGFRDQVVPELSGKAAFFSVVVENHLIYRKPIVYEDKVIVQCFLSHIREKSYRFNYIILNPETGEEKARGYSVMVGFDYKTGRVSPLNPTFMEPTHPYTALNT
ncbi:MAG: acyl-CoA thioesterase [Holophagae bacterium]|nr:acyl-CoA thioesterase [Holophagae bacterium]